MQKRLLLSIAVGVGLVISASVQATARYDNNLPMFESGAAANRADIEKQIRDAHASGVPVVSNLKALQSSQSPSRKTRAQVREELEAAAQQGLLNQHDTVYPRTATN
ncbi:hypothetical protein AB870_14375 [Pandoraea faecigallinarum]|uniref:DUF4148 domain-containing protein n=1 Tax=Pandoraea faecigallinarum TaxID=656179 RepID=A0A0H3WTT8_9BURK|nr:DUF4148 domain-containing protein [Pandoraea faecigallinarum]AKM31050.1 hypothetical protein AB870_14375 [Pandoraea faecigallinarum]